MKPLDPFVLDLETPALIEASAGTGKTYTITTLYARLVAAGYAVSRILVVTFTEAAAAELKIRIRDRLSAVFKAMATPPALFSDDLAGFLNRQPDPALIQKRLKLALMSFDQAAVTTIHAFCLNVLKENAFESRILFDTELMPDRSAFMRQVGFDFFMRLVNGRDPLFLTWLSRENITPDNLVKVFDPMVFRPGICLKPFPVEFEDVFEDYRKTVRGLGEMLRTSEDAIRDLVLGYEGLDKRSYSRKYVPEWLARTRTKIQEQGDQTLFRMTENGDALYKFTITRLAERTRSGRTPPAHPFFDGAEHLLELEQSLAQNFIHVKAAFFSFSSQALAEIKAEQGVLFFDDLINDLATALETGDGPRLAQTIRQTYGACLIDEFQDTDPRQYDIFSTLFFSEKTPFFMIGDPKQAIYGFRGGDIFAYLNASARTRRQYTLEKNYRSSPLLVQAVQTVFSLADHPFVYDRIGLPRVKSPDSAQNRLIEADCPVPPLQICFVERRRLPLDKNGWISRETAEKEVPRVVARDILGLLASSMSLQALERKTPGRRPLHPGDVAVLVRTNRQARQIQQALSADGIPSYLAGAGSVWDSRQALDLRDILWAVYRSRERDGIPAALCTSVFGFSAADIRDLIRDEARYTRMQEQFRSYRDLWEKKGVAAMIMALFHSEDAFFRKESALDERGFTHFYHLTELVSQAALSRHPSPRYLLKWYDRQLSPALREESGDELRLETDGKAVAVVTIHKSKGLEYPVVYLPYLWEPPPAPPTDNIVFHDPADHHVLTLDLGSSDIETARSCFEIEDRSEQRRLLYVALTRASALCRVIWGGFRKADTSALGSLLHPGGCPDDPTMLQDLDRLTSDPGVRVACFAPGDSKPFSQPVRSLKTSPAIRISRRRIQPAWALSSFSSLTQTPTEDDSSREVTFHDPMAKRRVTLADFPKGAGTGDFFHAVLENLDFSEPGTWDRVVPSMAGRFGLGSGEWPTMAGQSLSEVLGTRLSKGPEGFRLMDIPLHRRINEMEFVFPVDRFQPARLQKALAASAPDSPARAYGPRLSRVDVDETTGYMKGFIDLIVHHQGRWYLLDYKTNYLGDTYGHYTKSAMTAAMTEHDYFLQYHLYVPALHQYLSHRSKGYDYDAHFGGVFYLFLRGMHPDYGPDCGVFFDRPSRVVLDALIRGGRFFDPPVR